MKIKEILIKNLCTSVTKDKLYDFEVIIEVLEKSNIMHFKTLDDLVSITQKKWLRKPTTDRTEIKVEDIDYKIAPLHLNQDKLPNYDIEYDHVLILGAGANAIINRLNYINKLIRNGLKYKNLFMIYGYREAK